MEARANDWYTLNCVKNSTPIYLPDVMAIVGDGSSVTFYIKDKSDKKGYRTETTGKNLKKFEGLFGSDFVRTDQQHIVNLHYVERLEGFRSLNLKDPLAWKLTITDTYRKGFKAAFGR